MQTLSFEIATTFLDDAAALASGAIKIIIQILNQPVERLANACDVAGVLPRRRAFRQALRQTFRRRSWRNCLLPLRGLRDLT